MREPIVWLVAVFVFLVLELISMGLTTIWFAGGSVVAFVASLFGAPIPVQSRGHDLAQAGHFRH